MSHVRGSRADIVPTAVDASRLEREPLLIVEPLVGFLDAEGLGSGRPEIAPLGDGHSNVTYAIRRGKERYVLRRPPRGPRPPSAHDVLREARVLSALGATGVRVPEIVATCNDLSVIGAPFYVMRFIDGHVLSSELPAVFSGALDPALIAWQLVDELVELHALGVEEAGLSSFGRGDGYLGRQLSRFRGLLDQNATRPLPELEEVADWLGAHRPTGSELTVVHGDYRLGNAMFGAVPEPRLLAVLDWEMATIGDPLADVGYMTVMWAESHDFHDPMLDLSAVTRSSGFPNRAALAERYAERSGRDLARLGWYQVLALWKSAIFLESSYNRYLAGTTDDDYFGRLGSGVPAIARRALRWAMEYES